MLKPYNVFNNTNVNLKKFIQINGIFVGSRYFFRILVLTDLNTQQKHYLKLILHIFNSGRNF